jgi:hypothetical protein
LVDEAALFVWDAKLAVSADLDLASCMMSFKSSFEAGRIGGAQEAWVGLIGWWVGA